MGSCLLMTEPRRCPWCGSDPLYVAYHDEEWGRPCRDETRLFEFLLLEGAQAGLSWITILRKREHYRRAFSSFDAERIARFTEADIARLMLDPGIVRNRRKIEAAIGNARAVLALRERGDGLSGFLWCHVDDRPIINHWRTAAEVPVSTPLSVAISRQLQQRGMRFVGPTIVYSLLQVVGIVCDHLIGCHCHPHHEPTSVTNGDHALPALTVA